MSGRLSLLEYVIVLAYLVGTVAFGLWIGRRVHKGRDLFLAGKSLPWWAIGFSLVATDIGGTDIIGVGGAAYTFGLAVANFEWLGCVPAMILAAFVFIPMFWRAGVYTDVIQCIVMIAGCLAVLVIGLVDVGGVGALVGKIREIEAARQTLDHARVILSADSKGPFPWPAILFGLGLILGPAYWIGNQAIVQRSSSRSVKRNSCYQLRVLVARDGVRWWSGIPVPRRLPVH